MYRYTWLGLFVLIGLTPVTAQEQKAGKVTVTGPADAALVPFDELMTSFLSRHKVPGAALAVTKDGRLVYARGFGYADAEQQIPILASALFRIASISKPITAVAILKLIEEGKLKLDDHPFDILKMQAHLEEGKRPDPRLQKVTIRHLLQHTGGWDRAKSYDPMFRSVIIAKALKIAGPAQPEHVIRYMLGQPLDFEPGARYAYSNFGYCVLGRVIEKVTGLPYDTYVRRHILEPLGIRDTRLGKTLADNRAAGEVCYFDNQNRTGVAIFPSLNGRKVPLPYGVWNLEAMDSHGGWISSAVDLVRFASAFDRGQQGKILNADSIRTMFARPEGSPGIEKDGKPKAVYYGCGWSVRPIGERGLNTWHTGALDGTATILVRRHDGLNWAVLFNSRANPDGQYLAGLIDPLVHQAADRVKNWPTKNLFTQGN